MKTEDVLAVFESAGAVLHGHFILTSGLRSSTGSAPILFLLKIFAASSKLRSASQQNVSTWPNSDTTSQICIVGLHTQNDFDPTGILNKHPEPARVFDLACLKLHMEPHNIRILRAASPDVLVSTC